MSNYTTSCVISQDKYNDRLVCATIQVMSVCVCMRRIEFPVSIPKSFPTWSTVFFFSGTIPAAACLFPGKVTSYRGLSSRSKSRQFTLSASLPPVCARIHTPTRNPMAQCRHWAATASHSIATAPKAFQVFPILVLEALSYKFLTEGPTCKCIPKLGHCISVLSSQNCHLLYNLSPKHNYFSSPIL